jgi:predicted DNA-binding transcriptional regulator AlpA
MVDTKLFTIKEALKIVPLSRSGMWLAIKRGEVPSVRVGGRVFIPAYWVNKITAPK